MLATELCQLNRSNTQAPAARDSGTYTSGTGDSDTWQRIVTDDGSSTLRHPLHKETYHSKFGALTESISVFLQNSGVMSRLQAGTATRVLEIGFGTGLNFMVTADAAQTARCPLDYVAVEINPVADDAFSELLASNFPDQHQLVAKTIDAVQVRKRHMPVTQGQHSAAEVVSGEAAGGVELSDYVTLRLLIADALTTDFQTEGVHAVYLDAFSPKNNPDLWAAPFLSKVKQLLAKDAVLVSYCVSRPFRDGLTKAGYTWRKVKGPPGKREVLIARVN